MRHAPKSRNIHSVTRKDPSLAKILTILLLLFAVAYGGLLGVDWVRSQYFDGDRVARAYSTIEEARELAKENRNAEIQELLRPIVSRVSDPAVTPEALYLLARAERAQGDASAAEEYLKRATQEYPESPFHPKASVAYAQLLENRGELDAAYAIYGEVKNSTVAELRAPALTAFGRKAEREDDLLDAREFYRSAVEEAAWDSDAWNEALDHLGDVNVKLIFSPMETPESKVYQVESGDNLTSIGVRLNTTQGLLTRANGINDPTSLRVGQRLKYTPKDFRIVIERSARRIFLLDNNGIFKRYYTGLGKPGSETTLGSYRIGNKQKDPTWFKPGYGPIPPNDPRNELATRWMPMVPEEEGLPEDLGIHGTIAPETIGEFSSNGCARMYTEEVEELYDLVVRSTPVDVIEEFTPDML